ncbi:Cof-type HAD-IIB family hydrolase [Neobacillus massiliamazoniensis]|uniref:HAD superfamily hydrolase n=1 Tax=Neobacillus massiliamazoniensis TaxID=1499688 RepID=A0A0U1NVU1_9BACI|nr:Cof-type HAD-IIB family hydrolase [Neobacillus massiliamazoniensis]CRK82164.1 HAD superfamily hydrolase [Neobacillus massiliamazoniensis]
MKYRLLATDLDGTLLNEQKEIAGETIKAIQEYRLRGGKVVICSGRSPLSTRWIANTIGLSGEPIIAYNGAIMLDENGEVHEQVVFQHDPLLSFWELCEAEGIYAHFYEGDTLLVPVVNKWNENWIENNIPTLAKSGGKQKDCERFRGKCEVKVIEDFYDYFKTNQPKITKIAVFDNDGKLSDFSKQIGEMIEGLEISSSLNYLNLEISPSGVTKASALLRLAEKEGIPISQIAAIGDNYNDSLMLSIAGLGIAMGNAPEKVKQMADQVTGNNNEAGVADAIRRYLLE